MSKDPLEKYIDETLLTRQVASLLASGSNVRQIADVLNISWDKAKKIAQMDQTKAFLKEVGEVAIAAAKVNIRQRLAKMSDQVILAIEAQLQYAAEHPEKGHTDVIKVVLKGLGFQDQEQQTNQATQLTVVLPGASEPKKPDFEVK